MPSAPLASAVGWGVRGPCFAVQSPEVGEGTQKGHPEGTCLRQSHGWTRGPGRGRVGGGGGDTPSSARQAGQEKLK